MTFPFSEYRYCKQPFSEMAKNQDVEFLEFRDDVWQKKPAKRLKVRHTIRYGAGAFKSADLIVTYFFLPRDGWVCGGKQTYSTQQPSRVSEHVYVYQDQYEGKYPFPRRFEEWIKEPSGPKLTAVTEVNQFERCSPFPISKFTLSAFGLPEPNGVDWGGTPPWYLWFIGAAVLCLIVAAYFWRRVEKRNGVAGKSPAA